MKANLVVLALASVAIVLTGCAKQSLSPATASTSFDAEAALSNSTVSDEDDDIDDEDAQLDEADFDEIADRIVALTRDLAGGAEVRRTGSAGRLPLGAVTPLAMVLAELLSNAVQHGLAGQPGLVTLQLERSGRRITAEVRDDGVGLPEGFSPAHSAGLGLRIVRTLVAEELSGAVTWEPSLPTGTTVAVDVLLPP